MGELDIGSQARIDTFENTTTINETFNFGGK